MRQRKQVFLAVDANNISISARHRGNKVRYDALLNLAKTLGPVTYAAVYVGYLEDEPISFLIALKAMGFQRVVSRPNHRLSNGARKSDIDTILALDVQESVLRGDTGTVILVTGDSDFIPLVERLVARGIDVWVVGPKGATFSKLRVTPTQFLWAEEVEGLLIPQPAADGQVRERLAA